jgi:hypothetical protein
VVVSKILVQRGEPDLAPAQLADHRDQILEGAAVAVERGDHEGVAALEEGVAGLELRAGVVLAGFPVHEDPPAPGRVECVGLPVEVQPVGRDPGVADADLDQPRREGGEKIVDVDDADPATH